jgi:hypothetical protein
MRSSAVPAHLYVQHVQQLLNNSGSNSSCQLAKEFDELNLLASTEKQYPSHVAAQPANMDKNRYNNVLPCKYFTYKMRGKS